MFSFGKKAAYQVCGVTAPSLKELWVQGSEEEKKQDAVLENLNKNTDKDFLFVGTVKVSKLGFKQVLYKAQVRINLAEIL